MQKLLILTIIMFLGIHEIAKAQLPEQDCINAIPITMGSYYQPNAYIGEGAIQAEINSGTSCLGAGELNDVWYQFTAVNAGSLGFVIIPDNTSDDYDWAVFDITTFQCPDIINTPAMQVSCNFSGTTGSTGPNGGSTAVSQGSGGTPFNAMLTVQPGESYVINVSNYSSNQSGYTIVFSDSTSLITSVGPGQDKAEMLIAPNPVVEDSWFTLPYNEELELVIFNSTGQEARHYYNIKEKLHFIRGDMPPGMYLCTLSGKKGAILHRKLVIAAQ